MNKKQLEKIKDLLSFGDIKAKEENNYTLTDKAVTKLINEIERLRQFELQVSRDFCGHCEDCKFWKMENLECKNDIVWLNRPDNIFLNISDLKTNLKFGCIRFESKNSG